MNPTRHILLISPDPLPLNGTVRATHTPDVFAAISILARPDGQRFDAVVARASCICDRPAAATSALRDATHSDTPVLLLADPEHEPLARGLTAANQAHDYLVHPTNSEEITKVIDARAHTLLAAAPTGTAGATTSGKTRTDESAASSAGNVAFRGTSPGPQDSHPSSQDSGIAGVLSQDVLLRALLDRPTDAVAAALTALAPHLPDGHILHFAQNGKPTPKVLPGQQLLAEPVANNTLYLLQPAGSSAAIGRDILRSLAPRVSMLAALQDRHTRLQQLAITDELTGLANSRYFHHFLARVMDRAKQTRTPATLLLFDIDNFKKYNDQFGHAAGDEILQAVSQLMKRCVREHDLVARLGGDEFAVIFWDTGSPRQLHDLTPDQLARAGKPLSDPVVVFNRFRRLLSSHQFKSLGPTGKGQLTISGGIAVFPYDATTPAGLIEAADKCLMFGSKRSGKNTLTIVGDETNK